MPGSRSRSRNRSRSRSPAARRNRSRSRTRSRSRDRYRSRSRSRSRSHRRREYSRSPMSNRRRHVGNRENPTPSKCLGVFGLSLFTTERQLEKEFGRFGEMSRVQIVLDGHSGRSRGFGFVYYEHQEDADEARDKMNGTDLDGKKLRVDYSITKRAHTPTPGMYMGRPTAGSSKRRSPSPYRRRSPSPYDRYDRRRSYRSRSRSYSPRRQSPSPARYRH